MKKMLFLGSAMTLLFSEVAFAQVTASADYLTGDTRLACEAILCFSTSQRPSECNASIRKYFSIKKKKPHKTRKARKEFLNMCPTVQENQEMQGLVEVIMNAEDRCTAEALNRSTEFSGRILKASYDRGHRHYFYESTVEHSNELPSYCKAYFGHEWTDFGEYGVTPVFVGESGNGGFWAEYDNKASAELEYRKEVNRREQIAVNVTNFCNRGCHFENGSCFDNGR